MEVTERGYLSRLRACGCSGRAAECELGRVGFPGAVKLVAAARRPSRSQQRSYSVAMRPRQGTAVVALAFALLWAPASTQSLPSWLGKSAASGTLGSFAGANPFKFLHALAQLNDFEQQVYLEMVGEGLKVQLNSTCNVFGGSGACQQLPSDSKFAAVCKEHDLKVDCMYYDEDLVEVADDPVSDVKDALSQCQLNGLENSCPECFENQRRLWCAQTVPKCGSFHSVVEGAILPALEKISDAVDKGKNQLAALGSATPLLANAMALSMPCREMCESVMSSCSCGKERSFGDLLQSVIDNQKLRSSQRIPPNLSKLIFGDLLERPLCSLFASHSTPGFSGHCDELPTQCSNEKHWCQDGNPGPAMVQQLIAGQIAKGLFGWIGAPASGLWADRQALIDKADSADVKKLETKYVKTTAGGQPEHSHGGSMVGVFIMVLCLLVVGGALGALGYHSYLKTPSSGDADYDVSGGGYIPMSATEEAYGPQHPGAAGSHPV